jgi:F0F1-type ATP synthase membrane subunit b/b'
MGDINSAFVAPRAIDDTPARSDTSGTDNTNPEHKLKDVLVGMEADAQEILEQAQAIEEQLIERPLAKMQAELEKEDAVARSTTPEAEAEAATELGDGTEAKVDAGSAGRALLKAKDGELARLQHVGYR